MACDTAVFVGRYLVSRWDRALAFALTAESGRGQRHSCQCRNMEITLYSRQLWISAKLQLWTWRGTLHLSVGLFGVFSPHSCWCLCHPCSVWVVSPARPVCRQAQGQWGVQTSPGLRGFPVAPGLEQGWVWLAELELCLRSQLKSIWTGAVCMENQGTAGLSKMAAVKNVYWWLKGSLLWVVSYKQLLEETWCRHPAQCCCLQWAFS